jgi:twitching motility two-component system response regulator PilG
MNSIRQHDVSHLMQSTPCAREGREYPLPQKSAGTPGGWESLPPLRPGLTAQAHLPPHSNLILVIDDSPTVRKILVTCFSRAALRVKAFADGVEALRWLNTPEGEIPALIYLDLGLPRMDGYEVLRWVRTKPELRNTVVIILSARDGILERLKSRLAGAQAYVTKPFRTQDLVATTRAALGLPFSHQPPETPFIQVPSLTGGR